MLYACEISINLFAELKTEFIEEDGRDPHLHEHLRSIGEVAIPPTITKMRTVKKKCFFKTINLLNSFVLYSQMLCLVLSMKERKLIQKN